MFRVLRKKANNYHQLVGHGMTLLVNRHCNEMRGMEEVSNRFAFPISYIYGN